MTKSEIPKPGLQLLRGTDCFDVRKLAQIMDNLMGTVSTDTDIARIQAKLAALDAAEGAARGREP